MAFFNVEKLIIENAVYRGLETKDTELCSLCVTLRSQCLRASWTRLPASCAVSFCVSIFFFFFFCCAKTYLFFCLSAQ